MDQSRPAVPPARPVPSPDAAAPGAAPKPKSSTRTLVLLGVLAFVVACYAHDYFIAGPKASKANDDLHKFVDARNGRGVRDADGKLVDSSDVQQELGRKPSSTEEVDGATVEVYRYWGGLMPHRQYLAVLYAGNPRHYQVHHLNHMPYKEDFPQETEPRANSITVPSDSAGETTAGGPAAPDSNSKSTEVEAPVPEPKPSPDADPYADPAAPVEGAGASAPATEAPAAEEVAK